MLVCLLCVRVRVRTFCSSTKQAHIFLCSPEFGQRKENSFLLGVFGGVGGASQVVEAISAASVGVKIKKNGERKKNSRAGPFT